MPWLLRLVKNSQASSNWMMTMMPNYKLVSTNFEFQIVCKLNMQDNFVFFDNLPYLVNNSILVFCMFFLNQSDLAWSGST